jgi:hypothetical protein
LFKNSDYYLGEKYEEMRILDHEFEMDVCPEPSDVIWENLYSDQSKAVYIKGFAIIAFTLLLSASLIFYMQTKKRTFDKYDSSSNAVIEACEEWSKTFKIIKSWSKDKNKVVDN